MLWSPRIYAQQVVKTVVIRNLIPNSSEEHKIKVMYTRRLIVVRRTIVKGQAAKNWKGPREANQDAQQTYRRL